MRARFFCRCAILAGLLASSPWLACGSFGNDAVAASEVNIIGPNESVAGELVVLHADCSGKCAWDSVPAVNFLTFDDNKTLVFASPKNQSVTFILAAGSADGIAIVKHTLKNGTPGPGPDPDPDPDPEPLPPSELWGVVVEESKDRTPEQAIVLASPEVRKLFLDEHFRIVDPLIDGKPTPVSADVKQYADRAIEQSEKLPVLFLVSPDGKIYYEGPLPETIEAMKTLVAKYEKGGVQ